MLFIVAGILIIQLMLLYYVVLFGVKHGVKLAWQEIKQEEEIAGEQMRRAIQQQNQNRPPY